jgi:hypothetical protein
MDTPGGRKIVPATPGRLHGGDRGGLGEKGWAEEDEAGHPDDTNIPPDFHQPRPPVDKNSPA